MQKASFFLPLFLFLTSTSQAQDVNFYVSPTGRDAQPGTLQRPFATPERARDAVRRAKAAQPNASFTVYFRAGTYPRTAALQLTEADSGRAGQPVIYRAYAGERVIFHGGKRLSGAEFRPVTDPGALARLPAEARQRVFVADLRRAGITDYGTLRQHGFGTPPDPTALDVFVNGEPQTLAHYPNRGILKIGRVYDKGSAPRYNERPDRGAVFGYDDDRTKRWAGASDVWLQGKFFFGYADDFLRVDRIDTLRRTIRLAQPHVYGVNSSLYYDSTIAERWMYEAGRNLRGYQAYNLLEELDEPGEWYLDRQTGRLYLYPTGPLRDATVDVSLLEKPFVELRHTAHIRWQGIWFTTARGMGIFQEATHHVAVDSCRFSNLGTVAVAMGVLKEYNSARGPGGYGQNLSAFVEPEPFHHNTITNCLIYNTGTGGVTLDGGNRQTLQSGHNAVIGCEFHHVDRVNPSYSASVSIRGVGAVVRNCFFHDLRHWAISFMGNDHRIEYNRFERVCTQADDMGVIYTGRNPSGRGTVIEHNFFAHNEPVNPHTSMCGVYIDDGAGGITVRRNLFYQTGNPGKLGEFGAVFVHGGFDNPIEQNLFLNCRAGVGNAPWSDERWKTYLLSPVIKTRLREEVDITSPLYQRRYPDLAGFFESSGRRLNPLRENVAINGPLTLHGELLLKNNLALSAPSATPQTIAYPRIAERLPALKPFPFGQVGLLNPLFSDDSSKRGE